MRKTFNVQEFKEHVNDSLLNTADDMVEFRQGQMRLLEKVLMESGNYHGFGYLTVQEMRQSYNGTTDMPGIREYIEEERRWEFEDTDSTRVRYF